MYDPTPLHREICDHLVGESFQVNLLHRAGLANTFHSFYNKRWFEWDFGLLVHLPVSITQRTFALIHSQTVELHPAAFVHAASNKHYAGLRYRARWIPMACDKPYDEMLLLL